MAVMTIRNLDEGIKTGLRIQAAQHGCSMEEAARKILAHAIQDAQQNIPLGDRLQQLFAGVGEIDLPPRHKARPAPDFGIKPRKKQLNTRK